MWQLVVVEEEQDFNLVVLRQVVLVVAEVMLIIFMELEILHQ